MKIVVDRDIPFLRGVLEPFAEVVYLRGSAIAASDIADADALLVRTRTRCDKRLLEGSRVKFIGTATIGFDHIDMEYCANRRISIATAAGSNARGVLQWVSAGLAWLTGSGQERDLKACPVAWRHGLVPCRTTLGVVGVGNVGGLVAGYASEWGFRVMRCDPPRRRVEGPEGFYSLEEIAAACDVITFHVPLVSDGQDATRGVVGREFLAATKPGAVIINSSRGAIINAEVLREAVGCGSRRNNFIIDTWNDEPEIDREVLAGTLLATPHIAGYTAQGKASATAMIVNALALKFGLLLRGLEPPLSSESSLELSSGLRQYPNDGNWFPDGVPRSVPRSISWDDMCASIPRYFDIAAESASLKAAPGMFEKLRGDYSYRTEFF